MYADRPLSINLHACSHYFNPVLSEKWKLDYISLCHLFFQRPHGKKKPLSVEVVQYAMLKVVIVPCMHASKSIWELLKSVFYYYSEKDAGDETECHLESTDAIHFPMDLLIENTIPSQKDSTQFHSKLFPLGLNLLNRNVHQGYLH